MSTLVPDFILRYWDSLPAAWQTVTISTTQILIVTVGVILTVAFAPYFERKVIGFMQARVGPNRVGPLGLGQPFADVLKLLIKEVIVPRESNRFLFLVAPLLSLIPALATWAVMPLSENFIIAD